jgi:NAD(P)-dependent dehydrogenase (short-subunit alcohol dehydrogenase family)
MTLDGFQSTFDKLWGYVNSVRLGLTSFNAQASLVLISGFPARKCLPGASAISTVGNAIESFVRAIAPEISPRRINAVSPGIIDTPLFTHEGPEREQFLQQATGTHPISRPGTPAEVAQAVLFLIKNDFTTGSVVNVDGGATLP